MNVRYLMPIPVLAVIVGAFALQDRPKGAATGEELFLGTLNVNPPPIQSDAAVKYDYDIVYVRARRAGDMTHRRFYTDIATPVTLEPGADLMLLHPDGREELLVAGGEGAVTDPVVSFDGQSVYYTLIHTLKGANAFQPPLQGADIYKIHVPTRKIVRLTHQQFTPNTGAASWSPDCRQGSSDQTSLSYGVLNFGAFPLPGGRIVFTSNRNAFRPPRGYPRIALQLFVMNEDGSNVEQIGHLNLAGALHPVVLTDGRIIFSSLESQGIRDSILWGIWSIHPDGTSWGPVVSAFDPGAAPSAFHFQTQLSDGSIVVEGYYNQNNSGFGAYVKLPLQQPSPAFGPAYMRDERVPPWRFGRHDNGKGKWYRMPFMPLGSETLTPFARLDDGPADPAVLGDRTSAKVGKVTHPSGAPDNHLLTIYSPGPANHQYSYPPQIDGGIYLIKDGKPIHEPGQMLLIKNDPNYNEQWPRALVPYRRIYGIDEPRTIPPLRNDGSRPVHLPEGTPFGLVGSASLYKRESYPNGLVPEGGVTAAYAGGNDPWKGLDAFTSHGNGPPINWHNQGGDVGLYANDDIHALRILVMEPTTDRNRGPKAGRLFFSHPEERLRILGEIPVRKLGEPGASGHGGQPLDPDGNPDTSFLARIPADTAFTFQTLDRNGLVLNTSQTWHQLRPGEIRNDCGGCHAHSQKPTDFNLTRAGQPGYKVWDLTGRTPLLTDKTRDQSGQKWDAVDQSGLRFTTGPANVEYFRDIRPIFQKSCIACHTGKTAEPAGNLVLDADDEFLHYEHNGKFPATYYRLALDDRARYGHRPVGWDSWGYPQASRYVRKLQARRSLLTWKIHGQRLDGFSNDDHPSEPAPGAGTLTWKGEPVDTARFKHRADLDFIGSIMPPPDAVQAGKVQPLTDEDRRTLARWIDLGCPIDLDFDPARPQERGHGWMCDDNRPVLTVTYPEAGPNGPLDRLVVGMFDYYTGLDMTTFRVVADFAVDGVPAGQNLAPRFKPASNGVWELRLSKPITELARGKLTVAVQDRQGNINQIERTFAVGRSPGAAGR